MKTPQEPKTDSSAAGRRICHTVEGEKMEIRRPTQRSVTNLEQVTTLKVHCQSRTTALLDLLDAKVEGLHIQIP